MRFGVTVAIYTEPQRQASIRSRNTLNSSTSRVYCSLYVSYCSAHLGLAYLRLGFRYDTWRVCVLVALVGVFLTLGLVLWLKVFQLPRPLPDREALCAPVKEEDDLGNPASVEAAHDNAVQRDSSTVRRGNKNG